MLDSQLVTILGGEIERALVMGLPNLGPCEVIQKGQPTQEGTPTMQTVFFEKLFDRPRGWPMASFEKSDAGYTESVQQLYETNFQISSLAWQDPLADKVVTASDLVNQVHMFFMLPSEILHLNVLGVSILRVSDIRNPYFENDRHQFEAHPSFDIVVTHNRTIAVDIPAITSAKGELYPLPS